REPPPWVEVQRMELPRRGCQEDSVAPDLHEIHGLLVESRVRAKTQLSRRNGVVESDFRRVLPRDKEVRGPIGSQVENGSACGKSIDVEAQGGLEEPAGPSLVHTKSVGIAPNEEIQQAIGVEVDEFR